MMHRCATLALALAAVVVNGADLIDNGVATEPEVECGSNAIVINFNTKSAFEGHVYVKGHYDTPDCREDATLTRSANLEIPFSSCDVRRQRSSNPQGLYISVTVVITFHPMFITSVDKAYQVQCFYMEADRKVSAELGVSQLTTQVITQSVPMPTCTYQVLENDASGPPVRFATVGTQVYHQWSCGSDDETQDPSGGVFCMTVHSCMVDNGSGRQVQLLDENGCATDRFLLQNLNYTNGVNAGQSSMVFKFADQPTVFFQCQVRLTLKEGDECARTSDQCSRPVRGRRSADDDDDAIDVNTLGTNVDVFSESITVFDLDTPKPVADTLAERQASSTRTRHTSGGVFGDGAFLSTTHAGKMCLSPVTFGMLMAVLGIVLLTCLIVVAMLFFKRPHASKGAQGLFAS